MSIDILERHYAYLAGFIDGEGHIGIKKYKRGNNSPTYSERVSVGGICKLAIYSFNDYYPGYIYHHKPNDKSPNGFYSWEVTDNKAREFLLLVLPYLRIKKLEAQIVLALGKHKEQTKRQKLSETDLKFRDDLYRILKSLHKGDRYEKSSDNR